jgi:hypothetical protein
MFFNRKDIEWFKPIELKTRYGRRGHIREALGEQTNNIVTFTILIDYMLKGWGVIGDSWF